MNRVAIPPNRVGETVYVNQFNFLSSLAYTESVESATVTCSVYSGVDSNPSALLSGSAGVSSPVVGQLITGGVLGVIYELLCTAVTSGGQTLELAGYLAIIPDVP